MNAYWAMVADKTALGVLAAVYVGFNSFFAGVIISRKLLLRPMPP